MGWLKELFFRNKNLPLRVYGLCVQDCTAGWPFTRSWIWPQVNQDFLSILCSYLLPGICSSVQSPRKVPPSPLQVCQHPYLQTQVKPNILQEAFPTWPPLIIPCFWMPIALFTVLSVCSYHIFHILIFPDTRPILKRNCLSLSSQGM